MKFALLGLDADALELAQAVAKSSRHELVWACEVDGAAELLRTLAPRVEISEFWESLLASGTADAVIVARGADEDLRADQLRKLVQEGVPLLLVHPVNDSMLICYELDMIRRESGCVMVPYIPYRWHPALERLRALIAEQDRSDVGPTEQLVMERALQDRSRLNVARQFARDADLLRSLTGDLTSVSALAPGGKEATEYANLGVQLTGESGLLTRWSVTAVDHAPGGRLTLRGARGKATLELPAAGEATELEILSQGQTQREKFAAWSPAAVAIDTLEQAIAGKTYAPNWSDACRDVELTESIARSLAKGRTIELHDEEHSEHGTFKGTMTSLGCALLLASLVLLVVAATLAKLTDNPIFGYAPYFILGVLALFLIMQSLKLVFPSDK